jgi:hypothetical protein
MLGLGLAHMLVVWAVLAQSPPPPPVPAPTPLALASLQRELEWTRREHQQCRQALGQVWAQGEEAETKVKELTEKVTTLEAALAKDHAPGADEEKR